MPNLKISQLTGGGAAQAADEFVVARSGGNNKITGANVAAAATSVGTLTSLTVGGNLTVDTNTLFVDAANNSVGIGTTSPTQRLHLSSSGNPRTANNTSAIVLANSVTSRVSLIGYDDSQNFIFWNSTNAAGATQFYSGTGSGTLQMTLDSAGNLGLGVTPSAWASGWRVLEISSGFLGGASSYIELGQNVFYDGAFKYKTTAAATLYEQISGSHRWYNAPSGTAGNAISFTQAMTLDASGNLGVGTTSPTDRLVVENAAANVTARISAGGSASYTATLAMGTTARDWSLVASNTTGSYNFSINYTGTDAPVSNILTATKGGNVGIGTASPSVALHVARGAALNAYGYFAGGNRAAALAAIYGQDSGGVAYVWNQENKEVQFGTNNVSRWQINASGHLLAGADATYDIGASGATRPRDLYLSGNMVGGGWVRAGAASAGAASTTTIGSTTATTVGAAGGASALPATPLGYIIAHVGTTQVKIPYYNA